MLNLVLALAVSQVFSDEGGVEPPVPVDLSGFTLEKPTAARQIPADERVFCIPVKPGPGYEGGEVEVFCDPARRECLVAPMHVLDEEGHETSQPVQRSDCLRGNILKKLLEVRDAGYHFIWARAAAPVGWYRDERGRIMQANFDFTRRVWVGGGYSPFFRLGDPVGVARGRVDFGVAVSFKADRFLHQLRFLEGAVWVGQETRLDAALISYWWSVNPLHPPLYVTTFVGGPRRFDLPVSFSTHLEGFHFEVLPQRTFLTLSSASALMDLWHSDDLESYLRLRAGLAAEVPLTPAGNVTMRPEAAVEADFTLDRNGFHHLTASLTGEKLFFETPGSGAAPNPWRLRAKLGYEVILLAINDYPLTLVLDGRATYREDLPAAPTRWDFNAHAGLRMSFWAPARRSAPYLGPEVPPPLPPLPVEPTPPATETVPAAETP